MRQDPGRRGSSSATVISLNPHGLRPYFCCSVPAPDYTSPLACDLLRASCYSLFPIAQIVAWVRLWTMILRRMLSWDALPIVVKFPLLNLLELSSPSDGGAWRLCMSVMWSTVWTTVWRTISMSEMPTNDSIVPLTVCLFNSGCFENSSSKMGECL